MSTLIRDPKLCRQRQAELLRFALSRPLPAGTDADWESSDEDEDFRVVAGIGSAGDVDADEALLAEDMEEDLVVSPWLMSSQQHDAMIAVVGQPSTARGSGRRASRQGQAHTAAALHSCHVLIPAAHHCVAPSMPTHISIAFASFTQSHCTMLQDAFSSDPGQDDEGAAGAGTQEDAAAGMSAQMQQLLQQAAADAGQPSTHAHPCGAGASSAVASNPFTRELLQEAAALYASMTNHKSFDAGRQHMAQMLSALPPGTSAANTALRGELYVEVTTAAAVEIERIRQHWRLTELPSLDRDGRYLWKYLRKDSSEAAMHKEIQMLQDRLTEMVDQFARTYCDSPAEVARFKKDVRR